MKKIAKFLERNFWPILIVLLVLGFVLYKSNEGFKTYNKPNKKENNKHKIESIVELEKEYEQSALKQEVIIQLNLDEDLTKANCVNENINQLSENKNPEDNKNINNSDNSNKSGKALLFKNFFDGLLNNKSK